MLRTSGMWTTSCLLIIGQTRASTHGHSTEGSTGLRAESDTSNDCLDLLQSTTADVRDQLYI